MDGLRKILAFIAIVMFVLALSAPAMAQGQDGRMAQPQAGDQQAQRQRSGPAQSNKDLMATMEGMPEISMFTAAVKVAGYDQMLGQSGEGPYMVFAPTDMALQRDMGVRSVNDIVGNAGAARKLVESCVVTNVTEPEEGSNTITLASIGGTQIVAKKSGRSINVNGLRLMNPIIATNGLLAETDGVVGMPRARTPVRPSAMPSAMPTMVPTMMPGGARTPSGMGSYI